MSNESDNELYIAFEHGAESRESEIESMRQQLSATTAERDMWARSFKNGGTETMQKQLSDSKKREVLLREFVMEWLDRQGTDENYMVQKAKEALSATEPKP